MLFENAIPFLYLNQSIDQEKLIIVFYIRIEAVFQIGKVRIILISDSYTEKVSEYGTSSESESTERGCRQNNKQNAYAAIGNACRDFGTRESISGLEARS